MNRQLVYSIAIALVTAACNSPESSPTAPSAAAVQSSLSSTAAAADQRGACGAFGTGERITSPGGVPPTAPPDGAIRTPGFVSGGTPGVAPGPPPAGAVLTLMGTAEGVSGSCPSLTFTINGTAVRTNGTTTFAETCGSLASGSAVGVAGATQADGAIVASCVAGH